MSLRQVKPSLIVIAKMMGRQAGLKIDRNLGMSTARLEAHFLAGGDVMDDLRAIIAAHRAGIDMDFDRAAAVDLAGRDVLDAVAASMLNLTLTTPPRPATSRGSKHMDNATLLVVSMAEQCRGLILEWDTPDLSLPKALHPRHLLWMCNKIEEHAEDGPATTLYRWIGFVQCAVLAHRMLELDGAKGVSHEMVLENR